MEQQISPKRDPLGFLREHSSGYESFMLSSGEKVQVPKFSLKFIAWRGEPIRSTFGGKTVLEASGKPQFAELAIADLFKQQGFNVRWVETYGTGSGLPKLLLDWQDKPYKEQTIRPIEDQKIMDILKEIALLNGNSYSGCWDVFAWKGDHVFFIESKRKRHDRLRDTQRHWLNAGMRYGLGAENFIVIEWEVAP